MMGIRDSISRIARAGKTDGRCSVSVRTEHRLRNMLAASRQLLLALARERETDMPGQSMELRHLASCDR